MSGLCAIVDLSGAPADRASEFIFRARGRSASFPPMRCMLAPASGQRGEVVETVQMRNDHLRP